MSHVPLEPSRLPAWMGKGVRAAGQRDEDRRRTACPPFLGQETDPLTGLMNRAGAQGILDSLLETARLRAEEVAVLCVELADLYATNEVSGTPAGDAVLMAASARLRDMAGGAGRVARISGDKFLVMLHPIRSMGQVAWLAEQIAARLEEPVGFEGRHLACQVRIGMASNAVDTAPAMRGTVLIGHARMALDDAATEPGRRCLPYVPGTASRRRRRHQIAQALKDAIAGRQLMLAYQPQLDLSGRCGPAVEALLRWHHPKLGWIPPGEFIPIAEANGLILPLGRQVLQEACRQAMAWTGGAVGPVRIAVNVSPVQFADPTIYDEICLVLRETGLDPGQLVLEVTEGVLVQDVEATARIIERLKTIGVGTAIDDFGAGHSSLAYLAGFAMDELKMDRCFLPGGALGAQTSRVAQAIVGLAHGLGMEVVAEGVETAEQLAACVRIGCDRIQGFHHARPMSAAQAEQFLQAPAPAGLWPARPSLEPVVALERA